MLEKRIKKEVVMTFRPTLKEEKAIRFIANTYSVSLSDVILELIRTNNSIDELNQKAKNNIDSTQERK